jgi:dTDP-D-glucose 4,6-dehydratase
LSKKKLGWSPTRPLAEGLQKTYNWINEQVQKLRSGTKAKQAAKQPVLAHPA